MLENPFRPTRYEHMQQPLLWVSSTARQIEVEGSFYVQGTRGSGKTSLLRTLHWQERAFSKIVRAQIPDEPPRFLSIYFRLPDHLSFAVSRIDWSRILPEGFDTVAAGFTFFSYLLECSACYLLFDALEQQRAQGLIRYPADDAAADVTAFTRAYPELTSLYRETVLTYSDLANACLALSRAINSSAVRGTAREIMHALPSAEPGTMLSDAAILTSKRMGACLNVPQFHVKICIDDCEILRPEQQIALNTLVRKSKSPLYWIVSYVGTDYEATTGLYEGQNLTDADRRVINLDEAEESYFRRLCEAVSSLRVYNALSDAERERYVRDAKADQIFSLERVLGGFDLNRFLDEMRRDSISEEFEQLRKNAESLRGDGAQLLEASQDRIGRYLAINTKAPPYYQAYLLQQLMPSREIGGLANLSKSKARRLAAYLRRKQRSAMIAICHEFRLARIPYAGSQVAIGLSDSCIRDYLEIMAEIFDEFTDGPEKIGRFCFRRTPLPMALQRTGMVRAGENKFLGVRQYAESAGAELASLVAGLGELTALLQRDVRTAERGLFVVDIDEVDRDAALRAHDAQHQILRILTRGEADGLIRSEKPLRRGEDREPGAKHVLTFRLHRRFATKFGYSFRGPYEQTRLPAASIFELCSNAEPVDTKQWAVVLFRKIIDSDPRQPELFS